MAKRMLIDAAHPEETRVVVSSGNRLEEFDVESSTKKQVKGNIYLAKVTRVEPSLQAAFVDYGGNRHGFLAFSEIHPDYYRIPVSDREREEIDAPTGNGYAPAADDGEAEGVPLASVLPEPVRVGESSAAGDEAAGDEAAEDEAPDGEAASERAEASFFEAAWTEADVAEPAASDNAPASAGMPAGEAAGFAFAAPVGEARLTEDPSAIALGEAVSLLDEDSGIALDEGNGDIAAANGESGGESESVETLGGDEVDEVEEADAARRRAHPMRHYKIQEVVKRRQIMLVQVAKEERGNKGAALTTYLSLAGRYCVLMPNTNRGGGVSRKITSIADRRRLKDILEDLEIPEGMGVIVRTAGAERSKPEIKRDYDYLLRLWNEIRDLTLKSSAPALIYEEGNLIKRSIRDLYTRDLDEVLVEGEEGYKTAKAFMRTLMPSHAKRVQPYRDPQVPLFQRFQIESQIDAIHSPVAQLRSGGYIVINQTEALVSIDVNSGRSTRERNIEETALRTNLEAADEIARQLRLRDLAGLIVIDFIDMEEHRNQGAVERRLKEALKNDRARIQVGRISPFGLLEMSRQRLRPSLAEASTQPCPHCAGTGFIRSVESTALYVLRSIEEEGIRRRSAEICIYVPTNVALYILNQKRDSLAQIEIRYEVKVMVARDDTLIPPNFRLERLRPHVPGEAPPLRAIQAPSLMPTLEEERDEEDEDDFDEAPIAPEARTPEARTVEARTVEARTVEARTGEAGAEDASEEERGRRRRPRRRRRTKEPRETRPAAAAAPAHEPAAPVASEAGETGEAGEAEREAESRRRRRGRRGGRARVRRDEASEAAALRPVAAETIEIVAIEAAAADDAHYRLETPPDFASWPSESGVESGVEAASLAPLAGDGERAEPAPPAAHEDAPEPAAAPLATAPLATAPLATAPLATAPLATAPLATAPLATAEDEPGIPFAGEIERMLEEAAADVAPARREEPDAAPAPADDDDVRTITEKPPNPRRGWWQRLIQS